MRGEKKGVECVLRWTEFCRVGGVLCHDHVRSCPRDVQGRTDKLCLHLPHPGALSRSISPLDMTCTSLGKLLQIFYEEAISVMRRRECDNAVALLEKAVALAGEDSRRGGEFKLWAAQALQEVGRNKQAVGVLKSLKGHRDLDVRKVGVHMCARCFLCIVRYVWAGNAKCGILFQITQVCRCTIGHESNFNFYERVALFCASQVGAELLYIAQAPKLALSDKDFVDFPDVSRITEPYDRKVCASAGHRRRP